MCYKDKFTNTRQLYPQFAEKPIEYLKGRVLGYTIIVAVLFLVYFLGCAFPCLFSEFDNIAVVCSAKNVKTLKHWK